MPLGTYFILSLLCYNQTSKKNKKNLNKGHKMKQIQLPQITKDHLLSTKVGDETSLIIPMEQDCEPVFLYIQDRFYAVEEFVRVKGVDYIPWEGDPKCMNLVWIEASQMTPEQSRFHGVVVDVNVVQVKYLEMMENSYDKLGIQFDSRMLDMSYRPFQAMYNRLVFQHNEIHGLSIKPSLDDYVFYITIKRTK